MTIEKNLSSDIWNILYDFGTMQDCPTIHEIREWLKTPSKSAYLLETGIEMLLADPSDEEVKKVVFDLIHYIEKGVMQ